MSSAIDRHAFAIRQFDFVLRAMRTKQPVERSAKVDNSRKMKVQRKQVRQLFKVLTEAYRKVRMALPKAPNETRSITTFM